MATGAWKKYRERKKDAEIRDEIRQLAEANIEEARKAVTETVNAIAPPTASVEDRLNLELYLSQVPGSVRASLKRPEDSTGKTVPPSFVLNSTEDVLKLLPGRPPRFKPNDLVPGLVGWSLDEPLGAGGVHGDSEGCGVRVVAEAGELAEFHYPRRDLILGGELGEGFVERKESVVRVEGGDIGKLDPFESASVLLPAFPAGGVYQDSAHGFCSSEEVAAVLPTTLVSGANQPEVRLVHEGGGLKGLVGGFGRHSCGGELSQLVVHKRKEIGCGLAVTSRGGIKQSSHIGHSAQSTKSVAEKEWILVSECPSMPLPDVYHHSA